MTGEEFCRTVLDQFDQLCADGAQTARVMALALYPFATGQAFRAKYLDKALEYITSQDDVWLTTTDEIADFYSNNIVGRWSATEAWSMRRRCSKWRPSALHDGRTHRNPALKRLSGFVFDAKTL
jgi:hypothetical protein